MIRLHINIDHVATLRNARGVSYPDPVLAAELCELAGADGITAHLREDRRHMRDEDMFRLRHSLRTILNFELAPTDEMLGIAERLHPDVITLVPERRQELTTEGGLNLLTVRSQIEKAVRLCERERIKLSLFLNAEESQIRLGCDLGARQVELHTGDYCHKQGALQQEELERLSRASELAKNLDLEVAAGHGLTRFNVAPVAAIPAVEEVNIGHSVVADALLVGIERAVRELRAAIERGLRRRPPLTPG